MLPTVLVTPLTLPFPKKIRRHVDALPKIFTTYKARK